MNVVHPTILIGYGAYGLEVLQNLLSLASARSLLAWDEAEIARTSRNGERKLAVLAPFWIPDVLDLEDDARRNLRSSDNFEMMLDLYEQIETIEADTDSLAEVLTERVEAAKRRLFKQSRVQSQESKVSVGLDVIILARPTHETVMGKLRELLDPVITRLAEDPGLTAPRAGHELLNFIEILDFEDFWNSSPESQATRYALDQALSAAEDALSGDRPALGRLYIFDGRTEHGNQDARLRMNQAVLFLEFLLFEGKRTSAEFRNLYQREHPGASSLCFAGVRAVEFSGERLRRLAAASFGRAWVDHVLSPGPPEAPSRLVDQELARFAPENLDRTLDTGGFDLGLKRALREIEQELVKLDARDADWLDQINKRGVSLVEERKRGLAAEAAQQLTGRWLSEIGALKKGLVAAISQSMNDQQNTATLGGNLTTLRRWRQQMQAASEAPVTAFAAPEPVDMKGLAACQEAYVKTEAQVLSPGRLRAFWHLFAVAAAAVFLPVADGAVDAVFLSHPEPKWLTDTILASVLIVVFALLGLRVFHPLIARSVGRTLDFHRHPERGRLADAIRAFVASDRIQGPLQQAAETAKQTLRQRVLAEVQSILSELVSVLETRRGEVEWLNRQLGDYLSLQGVDTGRGELSFLANRAGGDVCRSVENDQDLRFAASQLTRDGGRFREVQRRLGLLERWDEPFQNLLLDPHRLLDELSQFFKMSDWQIDGDVAERRQDEITSAISSLERFPIGFYWRRTNGLPETVAMCSAPTHWLQLHGINQKIREMGYQGRVQPAADAERMYLLQTRTNVPRELLAI